MVRQVFTGSMIHVDEHDDHHVRDTVVFEDNATIFVEDGKVFNNI